MNTATTTTAGPVRKPDGTGRIHNRLGGDTPGTQFLVCGGWGAWQYVPVPAAEVRDGERCRRCWPGVAAPASGEAG